MPSSHPAGAAVPAPAGAASPSPDWIDLRSDKSKSDLVRTADVPWTATSETGGVSRKLIERLGTEKVARATTIVKFDPNQSFPRHSHRGGEEFLVLDGVWRDDYGAFSKYSYVRNYIGSGHTPEIGSEGCVILVKLRQMSRLSTGEPEHRSWADWTPERVVAEGEATGGGARKVTLFDSPLERTSVQVWPGNADLTLEVPEGGMELFAVDGSFASELGEHDEWSWCRVPNEGGGGKTFKVKTGEEDVYVWAKEGHLASDEVGVEGISGGPSS